MAQPSEQIYRWYTKKHYKKLTERIMMDEMLQDYLAEKISVENLVELQAERQVRHPSERIDKLGTTYSGSTVIL